MKTLEEVLRDLGGRHRPRGSRRADHAGDEDVLRLQAGVRRRAQHAHLPGVPGPAGRAARAEQGGHRVHRAGRPGHQLRHREALDVLPQELHVPRYVEELPDHAGPGGVLHAGPPRPGRGRPGRRPSAYTAAARSPPASRDGNVTRTEDGYVAHVGITRIHMEEDAGKMVHVGGGEGRIAGATHSLVDYNRCRHAA